jgi:hypothetical protein
MPCASSPHSKAPPLTSSAQGAAMDSGGFELFFLEVVIGAHDKAKPLTTQEDQLNQVAMRPNGSVLQQRGGRFSDGGPAQPICRGLGNRAEFRVAELRLVD